MAIALNVIALLLVVGISYAGMMWLAGRVHGRDDDELDVDAWAHAGQAGPCKACDGSGAQQRLGKLQPCPVCEGTGVSSAFPG